MPIKSWSSTAASNNAAPPNGAPENMAPSAVNDTIRQVMADVRAWYEASEWLDFGHTPTFVSSTSFTVTGDQTETYEAGRRIRIADTSALYGTIATSAYVTVTTVTVTLDSGSITAGISAVAVGAAAVSNPSIASGAVKGLGAAADLGIGTGLQNDGGDLAVDPNASGIGVPTGTMLPYGPSGTPTGFLNCDGSAVSRTTYATLFAALGTTYGVGDGSTTFNLPDCRGRAMIGEGSGAGLTARTLADAGGSETHTLTKAQLPAETLDITLPATFGSNQGGTVGWGNDTGVTGNQTKTTAAMGSGEAFATMPPFLAIGWIIKT